MTGKCGRCHKIIRLCKCNHIGENNSNIKCFNKYCKNTVDKDTVFCGNCISPHDDIEKALGQITIENEKLWDKIVYYRHHKLNYEADAWEIHFHAVRGTVAELSRKLLKND